MPDDIFTQIMDSIPEEDLPLGHRLRFEKRLDVFSKTHYRLWAIQRVALAASLAAFLVLSVTVALNMEKLTTQKTVLFRISPDLYETELFLTGEIQEKMKLVRTMDSFDKEVLKDIREIDKSYAEVRSELIQNPNDDRIISAIIETYRMKLEILDEILSKTVEKNI